MRRIMMVLALAAILSAMVAVSAGPALAQAPSAKCEINVNGKTYPIDTATCERIGLSIVGAVLRGLSG